MVILLEINNAQMTSYLLESLPFSGFYQYKTPIFVYFRRLTHEADQLDSDSQFRITVAV